MEKDTHSAKMIRLTQMLVSRCQKQKERILVAKATLCAKKLQADALAKSIDAQCAELAAQIREIVIPHSHTSENTPRDIASLDSDAEAEHEITKFQELEKQMKRVQQELEKRREMEETRARMLNTIVRPLVLGRSSAEINRCREMMDACCDRLRKIEAAKANISDDTEQLPGLAERKASLEAEMEILADKRSHVYDDYDKECYVFANMSIDYDKLDRSLILAEMLPDYEKYWGQSYHHPHGFMDDVFIEELWDSMRFYGDRRIKTYDESNEDVALAYFEEYLYTLVGTCNCDHYDKLRSTWDKTYTTLPHTVGWDRHGGVMFSTQRRGLDFTIHSKDPQEWLNHTDDYD